MLRCESGGVLKGIARCSERKARSLCDGGSTTRSLRPPKSEVQLQFCDDQPLLAPLRCQNAADECRIPLNECSWAVTRSSASTDVAGKEERPAAMTSTPASPLAAKWQRCTGYKY